jgi:multisubunit Na+/H+ antiporter MnhC subunit
MIATKYLGAVGVAVFMLGVAAGYSLSGGEPAPEAARFRVKPQLTANDQRVAQAMIVTADVMAPAAAWLALTGNGSN